MEYKASIRYLAGKGNEAFAARLRDDIDRFWDFVQMLWVTVMTSDCRALLEEHPEPGFPESRYSKTLQIPDDCRTLEIQNLATGDVYDEDMPQFPDNAGIAAIRSELEALRSDMATLLDIGQGNWKIDNCQMIFYKQDGTELMRFNLLDKAGNPSEAEVFKRERV